MIVGYTLDHVLGLGLSMFALIWAARNDYKRLRRMLWNCLNIFSDCATFFAFSIEVAAIIVLLEEDLGKSTNGMGDDTVRVTQAVAMVVLLPLIYPILTFRAKSAHVDVLREPDEEQETDAEKAKLRFGLLVLCWLLGFYPFYSKMNAAFGHSRIGGRHHSSGHAVLTYQQFDTIQTMCFGKIRPITVTQDNLMTAFVIATYIPLSLFVLGRILCQGVQEKHPDSRPDKLLKAVAERTPKWAVDGTLLIVYGTIPLLAAGLLWSIIWTQQSQQKLTAAFGGTDSDNTWTFGQIVAVTVFAPVLVECVRSMKQNRSTVNNDSKEAHSTGLNSPTTP